MENAEIPYPHALTPKNIKIEEKEEKINTAGIESKRNIMTVVLL